VPRCEGLRNFLPRVDQGRRDACLGVVLKAKARTYARTHDLTVWRGVRCNRCEGCLVSQPTAHALASTVPFVPPTPHTHTHTEAHRRTSPSLSSSSAAAHAACCSCDTRPVRLSTCTQIAQAREHRHSPAHAHMRTRVLRSPADLSSFSTNFKLVTILPLTLHPFQHSILIQPSTQQAR
jgi:hypothetical protein